MEFEVGDIVLCTVEEVTKTIVFVKIDDDGEGSIITSEVAPGRIRNLREYVVPKKKIVCKILRISHSGNIDLSLRRVTPKEKKEVMEKRKQEKSYKSIIKTVLGEKTDDIIKTIKKQSKLFDFMEESKTDSKELEKIVGKTDAKKIVDILNTQKQKKAILKKQINLTTKAPNGLEIIKSLLGSIKLPETEIKYLSASKYIIKTTSEDIKSADKKIKSAFEDLEKQSKKLDVELSITESKKKWVN